METQQEIPKWWGVVLLVFSIPMVCFGVWVVEKTTATKILGLLGALGFLYGLSIIFGLLTGKGSGGGDPDPD